MADLPKEPSRRAAYKAAEVCELAHIQPYVLRSWESEFPKLGVLRAGIRIYRQSDLEQVLRIKQLVFEEGLTLAGARRRIEEENGSTLDALPIEEFVTPEMRERLGRVKDGLRHVLTILGEAAQRGDVQGAADSEVSSADLAAAGDDGPGPARSTKAAQSRTKAGRKKAPPPSRAKNNHTARARRRA